MLEDDELDQSLMMEWEEGVEKEGVMGVEMTLEGDGGKNIWRRVEGEVQVEGRERESEDMDEEKRWTAGQENAKAVWQERQSKCKRQ